MAQIFVRIFNKHFLALELLLYISVSPETVTPPGSYSFIKVTEPTECRTLMGLRANQRGRILALMEFTSAGVGGGGAGRIITSCDHCCKENQGNGTKGTSGRPLEVSRTLLGSDMV